MADCKGCGCAVTAHEPEPDPSPNSIALMFKGRCLYHETCGRFLSPGHWVAVHGTVIGANADGSLRVRPDHPHNSVVAWVSVRPEDVFTWEEGRA